MATRGMQTKLSSGEITEIYLGGTGAGFGLVTETDIDAKVATKTTETYVDAAILTNNARLIDQVTFDTALPTPPAFQEGTIFWDPEHDAISGYLSIPGVAINFGFEDMIWVFNNTVAIILDGKPCKSVGMDATRHVDQVEMAQADTYENAKVIGIATHDIGVGEYGLLTTRGEVHDIATTGFTAGNSLYLSSTVAGGMVETPPDIVTRLGTVNKVGVSDGVVYVGLHENDVAPTVFGSMYDNAGSYVIVAGVWQDLDTYISSLAITCPVNTTTGTITPGYSGIYRTSFTINLSFTSSPSTVRSIQVRLYDVTLGAAVASIDTTIPVGKDISQVSRSMQLPHSVVADHDYRLQIDASHGMTVTIDDLSFDMQSIRTTNGA